MKCPRCGNEVSSEEAFCGQCGTPSPSQARPTEMVHTPPPAGGRPQTYPQNSPFGPQNAYGTQPPPPTQGAAFTQPSQPQGVSQRTGFHQDATEAMSVLPSNPNAGYQQQQFPVTPQSGAYPQQLGQYGSPPNHSLPPQNQLIPSGNYPNQGFPQPPLQAGQGYRGLPTPPQKPKSSVALVILSVFLVILLLSVVGVATLYAMRTQGTSPTAQGGVLPTATTAPTAMPTVAPTPTAAPTDVPTVALTPTIAPTIAPTTVVADPGFLACGQPCIGNGFTTEYPQAWSNTPLTTIQGVQFANPVAPDQSATFKTPGATNGAPSDIVNVDLNDNFVMKNGYTVVTPDATAMIGGVTWFKEVITYQGVAQKERVEVYGNVHQGKAYILELQAPDSQFDALSAQYFANIVNHFAFQ